MEKAKQKKYVDMTKGPIKKSILLFCLPILGGNIFTQLYNVVDSVVVGNFVGSDALAAVGASFSIFMMVISLFSGLSMGSNVVIAQYYGAQKYDEVKKTINTVLIVSFFVGIVLTALGLGLSKPILRLMRTPENIMDDAATYLSIIFCGLTGQNWYYMGSAILRGMGDSKYPMYFLIICSVANIALDLLFVIVFKMGVAGVAWATIISQNLSGIGVLIRVYSSEHVKFSFKDLRIDKTKIGPVCRIGIPSCLQMMASSIGMMIVQSFGNTFGSNFVATNTIVQKVDGFAQMPAMALSMAVTTFVGQCIGAGDEERAKKGTRFVLLLNIGIAILIGIIMRVFGKGLIHIFTDTEAVVQMGMVGISIMCFSYVGFGVQQALSGTLRGAGAAFIPMVVMIGSTFLRIPIAYFLAVRPNDFRGMFYALIITFYLGAICMTIYYLSGKWKNKAVVHEVPAQDAEPSAEETTPAE